MELKKHDDADSTDKPPLSEESDTKAAAELPYSSEWDRYNNTFGHIVPISWWYCINNLQLLKYYTQVER